MATIKRYLSPKVVNGVSEIFMRISLVRGKVWKFASGVFINPARLKDDGSIQYPRANQKEVAELREVEVKIDTLERMIFDFLLTADPARVERGMIEEIIDKYHHPEKYVDPAQTISWP